MEAGRSFTLFNGLWHRYSCDMAAEEPIGLVLARHGQALSARLRAAMSVTGLTPRHGVALQHLCEHGPTSQQGLLEVLGVDPSVLVAILNDLEGNGLAERRRDPADRRRHIVEMSDKGRAVLDDVDRAIDAVEQELLADLTPAEVDRLRELLAKVRLPSGGSDPCAGDD